ncbi:MAG: DUF1127 domain-containing protein [Alphaproteobacteria bacterium]|nr:DUF1127 domain-containing protein [Alphaproteobacteria bacterium]
MSTATLTTTLRRPHLEVRPTLFSRLFRIPMTVVTEMLRRHANRVAIARLSAMSDAQLRDLGIHRSQIPLIVMEIEKVEEQRNAYYSR